MLESDRGNRGATGGHQEGCARRLRIESEYPLSIQQYNPQTQKRSCAISVPTDQDTPKEERLSFRSPRSSVARQEGIQVDAQVDWDTLEQENPTYDNPFRDQRWMHVRYMTQY